MSDNSDYLASIFLKEHSDISEGEFLFQGEISFGFYNR
jgi:hypothetical protein